jgi:hypothetical protein
VRQLGSIVFRSLIAGFPHGMITTQADVINPDILAFMVL